MFKSRVDGTGNLRSAGLHITLKSLPTTQPPTPLSTILYQNTSSSLLDHFYPHPTTLFLITDQYRRGAGIAYLTRPAPVVNTKFRKCAFCVYC